MLDREATADDLAAAIGDDVPLDFILDTISAKTTKQFPIGIVQAANSSPTDQLLYPVD